MRNPWRLLLLRSFTRSTIHSSRLHYQVRKLDPEKSRYLSSFISRNAHQNEFLLSFESEMRNPRNRGFSSEAALEHKDIDHVVLTEIFSKSSSSEEIKNELESINLLLSHEMVLTVLQNLEESPRIASRFFNWVSEIENERLSSKSYNSMLRILGRKDHVKEFWDLVEIMKKKGYGISKRTYITVSERFEKDEMVSDLDKLKEMFTSKSAENSVEGVCSRVCKIVRQGEWGEDVEKRLADFNGSLSNNIVTLILEHLSMHPMKALMFFRWVEENGSFKHCKQTYNVMVKVLGREDCIEEFWGVLDEMKDAGYDMEMGTYIKVMGRFYKRKMIKEAVDLYEFAMSGANKPPVLDCTFLLQKIVVCKDLDMDLLSRVVRIFREGGNVLTKSILDAVLKSLTSVGKLGECNKILKAMEEGGFEASNGVQSEVVYRLSSAGSLDEANKFLDEMDASGRNSNSQMWASLIQGQCVAGDLDKASSCFRKMVENKGVSDAGYAFELLVNAFCHTNRAEDACRFVSEFVNEKQLRPWHTTYKVLIKKLLARGSLKEALSLLGLMKNNGFPPFLEPFIDFISKSGTGDDALNFLKALTVKRFPSTSVFLRMFEAFFKAGRHNEAHDCLSKCPGYIRNHADVLDLFCSMKPEETASATAVAA
ncbi:hypothetical protein HHK36_014742 [Tetracentron sinense]|uniref:Pentatricopeptide repeat-containing protein n=1 Tax=Tetracentron sinense TaxID=13715 RepID=A0A835DD00_TETSI|nr:hypothetical protein HHK36_014742 [Tetracentron sinense]